MNVCVHVYVYIYNKVVKEGKEKKREEEKQRKGEKDGFFEILYFCGFVSKS